MTKAKSANGTVHHSPMESLIDSVGAFGRYQKGYMALLQLQALAFSFRNLTIVFAVLEPVYNCLDPGFNNTDNCAIVNNCTNYTTSKPHGFRSIPIDWPETVQIACQGLFSPLLFIMSLRELFAGISYSVSGLLSDTLGRKPVILFGMGTLSIFAIATSQASSVVMFAGCYCIVYMMGSLTATPSRAIGIESTLGPYRLSINFMCSYCFAYGVVALMAYLLQDWRSMLILAAIGGLLHTFIMCFVPESPRWLLVHRKYTRAAAALNRIAWVNGKPTRYTADSLRKLVEPLKDGELSPPKENTLKAYVKSLRALNLVFHNRDLVVFFIFTLLNAFFTCIIAASFLMNAGKLSTSPYLSMALIGIFRFWTPFAIIGLDQYHPNFSRRVFAIFAYTLATIPLVVATVFSIVNEYQPADYAQTVFSVGALLSVSMIFGLLWYVTDQVAIEVFPTVARTGVLCVVSLVATLGEAVGPQVILLERVWKPLQFVLGSGLLMALFVGALLVLPETKDKELPDRFEETNHMMSDLADE